MSSKKNARKTAQNTVINNQNEEIMENVVIESEVSEIAEIEVVEVEVPETIETLNEKIIRIKAEQAAQLAELSRQKKELDEKVKQMKIDEKAMKEALKLEADKSRFIQLAELLEWPTLSKRDRIAKAILLGAASMEDVVEQTGFDSKLVSDTIWGLEKSVGLR